MAQSATVTNDQGASRDDDITDPVSLESLTGGRSDDPRIYDRVRAGRSADRR